MSHSLSRRKLFGWLGAAAAANALPKPAAAIVVPEVAPAAALPVVTVTVTNGGTGYTPPVDAVKITNTNPVLRYVQLKATDGAYCHPGRPAYWKDRENDFISLGKSDHHGGERELAGYLTANLPQKCYGGVVCCVWIRPA